MDIYQIVGTLEAVGFTISRSPKTTHWRCVSPSGKLFVMAATPSDRRAILNFRGELKRAGYDVEVLQAQLKKAKEQDHARRLHASRTEEFEKMIVHKKPQPTALARPRRTAEEIRAHRDEMRRMNS